MQSNLGWTFLSQNALARAEAQLNPEIQGVRDELGFMTLHRAYADRFFPGTTTQQTRLRYILFIPWIFRRVASKEHSAKIQSAIDKEEILLAGRLKQCSEEGVIGGRTYPRSPSQPASVVYWNALGSWNILLGFVDGSYPNRFQVYRLLDRQSNPQRLRDAAGQPLEEPVRIFTAVPSPPEEWDRLGMPLTFQLTEREIEFAREKLIGVANPYMNKPSLLARLAQERVDISSIPMPWSPSVMRLVDTEEQTSLIRASQAAAVTAVGRAVYAALVEEIREREDRLLTNNNHREHLLDVVGTYGEESLALHVPSLSKDQPSLPLDLTHLIKETQSWLAGGNIGNFQQLRRLYAEVEYRRKGRRARLPQSVAAQERRAEWLPEEHPRAGPLDYRWPVAKRLLGDLRFAQNG